MRAPAVLIFVAPGLPSASRPSLLKPFRSSKHAATLKSSFATPICTAASIAMHGDHRESYITGGTKSLRDAVCDSYRRFYNLEIDPERDVTVCCGATEA